MLQKARCVGNDQITMTAPLPVCSAKLSIVEPGQYYGGGPRWNPGCCSLFFFLRYCTPRTIFVHIFWLCIALLVCCFPTQYSGQYPRLSRGRPGFDSPCRRLIVFVLLWFYCQRCFYSVCSSIFSDLYQERMCLPSFLFLVEMNMQKICFMSFLVHSELRTTTSMLRQNITPEAENNIHGWKGKQLEP